MIILKYLIFPILFALIAGVSFFFISKGNKVWSNKKAILLTLVFAIIISLFGFASYLPFFHSMAGFFVLQLIFLLLGFIALFVWNKGQIELPQIGKTIWSGILFFLLNLFIGMAGFVLCYYTFEQDVEKCFLFSLSALIFALPALIHAAFKSYLQIPNDIYNVWHYNLYDEVSYDNIDTDKVYMLEIEYMTSEQSKQYSNSRIKAPIDLKFGDWFQLFIDYYNERTDDHKIEYVDEYGMPMGWMFFERSSSLFGNRRINPDSTILENKLSEKKVIIANRVPKTQTEE
jgi:hypothetical protein